jgi:FMN phosphatase YigB (HAD superfamily)
VNLTLLLDLDDTLLVNDIREFLPAYLKAFSAYAADLVPPEQFVRALLAGTERMAANRRPDCTLREIFDETFFPATRLDRSNFESLAERFYREIFPSLRSLTRPEPAARSLVEQALDRGYELAIATDPLFPLSAIEQRLAWAGLPADVYPFKLIPSYQSMHFSKSETAYFAEILAGMGWPDGPVVMVGDSFERDIIPAQRMGLPAFWINGRAENDHGGNQPSGSGQLGEVLEWIDSMPVSRLTPNFSSPSAILAILRATPAALDSLCRDLPLSAWNQHPEEGEWCLTEIICHLRDVESQVNLPRLKKVLQEVNPFMPGMDTDIWALERNYHDQDGLQALWSFTAARLEVLENLESLPQEAWQRVARHAIFGPTSLEELVGFTTSHDRLHLQQVQRTLAAARP